MGQLRIDGGDPTVLCGRPVILVPRSLVDHGGVGCCSHMGQQTQIPGSSTDDHWRLSRHGTAARGVVRSHEYNRDL